MKLKTKDLLTLDELTDNELSKIIDEGIKLKKQLKKGSHKPILKNKTLGMIFEKPSTRTRVSFETGMFQLGGHALNLSSNVLQLSRGESVEDTAKTLSRYVDAIMYRAFSHDLMVELARNSSVPVISGLDDLEHPCQILADLLTIWEHKGDFNGLELAYVGDGNNVCNSLLLGCALVGMSMNAGCPANYLPDNRIFEKASQIAQEKGSHLHLVSNPVEAVRDADIIYTDVWVSMGDEAEQTKREQVFGPYQVNADLVGHAKADCIVMHCLPAHRGKEITDEVMDSERSIVFDQAENRLHAQKALLVRLLGVE